MLGDYWRWISLLWQRGGCGGQGDLPQQPNNKLVSYALMENLVGFMLLGGYQGDGDEEREDGLWR